ncbi:hypothetical protein [Xanthobacter sp. KR7-225]|uniref:hypothetical protein n=1 Tax=Xanthobacter sp. KR7-225 TaxID=3156613 RepID=UPI0032B5CEA2
MGLAFSFRMTCRPKGLRPSMFLVAHPASAAPCGWIFFDGNEHHCEGEEVSLILPGGSLFPAEGLFYDGFAEAEAAADRLNDHSPCFDRPWKPVPGEVFAGEHAQAGRPGESAAPPRALRWRR